MAKLSKTIEAARERFERAMWRSAGFAAPVWIPVVLYTVIRAVLEGAAGLNTVAGLVLSVLFVTAVVLLFEVWRHCGVLVEYSLREFLAILLGFVMVFISLFAVLSSLLYDLDLAEYSSSGRPIHPGSLADFYMWHLIDSIPSLEVWSTLDINNPISSEDRPADLLILAFRTLIITPVIALAGQWFTRRLKGAPWQDAGTR